MGIDLILGYFHSESIIYRKECVIVVDCDLTCRHQVYYSNLAEVEGLSLVAFSFARYLN